MFRTDPNRLCVVTLVGLLFYVVAGWCAVVGASIPERNSPYLVYESRDASPLSSDSFQRSRLIQLSEVRSLVRQRLVYRAEQWLQLHPRNRAESNRLGANRAEPLVAEFLRMGVANPTSHLDVTTGTITRSASTAIPERVETLNREATAGLSSEQLAKVTEFLSGEWVAPDATETRVGVAVHALRGPTYQTINSADSVDSTSSTDSASLGQSAVSVKSELCVKSALSSTFSESRLDSAFTEATLATIFSRWDIDTEILAAWWAMNSDGTPRSPQLPNESLVMGIVSGTSSTNRLRDAGFVGVTESLATKLKSAHSVAEPSVYNTYLLVVQTVIRRE